MWRIHKFLIVCLTFFTIGMKAQNPNWIPPDPGEYIFNANMIAAVRHGDVDSYNVQDKIGVFDENGNIKGLGTAIDIGNGIVIHFITIYSGRAIDTFHIRVFHQATDAVYDVFEPYRFETQGLSGSIEIPYPLQIYPDNIPLFVFEDIPEQTTIESLPFQSIDLALYLTPIGNLLDSASVDYIYQHNSNLQVTLSGSILQVSGVNGFTGSTQLYVTAFIILNGVATESHTTITFHVDPLPLSPLWLPKVPSQGIVTGSQFDSIPLHQYENQFEGAEIVYDYIPLIREEGSESPPTWEVQTDFLHTMSVIAQINYTPKYHFYHEDDVLAFFADEQLVGVAYRNTQNGLYYVTIGSTDNDPHSLSLMFYSGAMRKFFSMNDVFDYDSYQLIGTDENPYIIDFAPILPIVPSLPVISGIYTMPVHIVDTNFIGSVTFTFFAKDPDYPDILFDTTNASFCIVSDSSQLNTYYEDYDMDGDGNPLISILACTLPDGYSENGNDCNDRGINEELITTSIFENSGLPNDGVICKNTEVTITVNQMADNYEWSTGETSESITVNPLQTSFYQVTVTVFPGCTEILSDTIWVEQSIVKNSMNTGFGSLRNVIFCAEEGDTITYDLPTVVHSELTEGININKNLSIEGDLLLKPAINVNFNTAGYGIYIDGDKALTLKDIDIKTKNINEKSLITGSGNLIISGNTVVGEF